MEVEWTVGPIPIEDKHGKEVVLRYASSLDSGEIALTSAESSKQMLKFFAYGACIESLDQLCKLMLPLCIYYV